MKYLPLTFLLSAVFSAVAQDVPKAQQIDKFGNTSCEEILARADTFQAMLNTDPSALGIVILDSPKTGRDKTPYYRRLILSSFQRRSGPAERLRFYGRRTSNMGGTFWMVPPGAETPVQNAELYAVPPFDPTRAFIWDTEADDGVCPTFAPNVYAELLKSNRNLRAHIVVHSSDRRSALRTAAQWKKEFTERWGVPREQLRLFAGENNKNWYSTDFWLVPVKSR